MGPVGKLRAVSDLQSLGRCRCGSPLHSGRRIPDGAVLLLHSKPICDDFVRLDITPFLQWLKTPPTVEA